MGGVGDAGGSETRPYDSEVEGENYCLRYWAISFW